MISVVSEKWKSSGLITCGRSEFCQRARLLAEAQWLFCLGVVHMGQSARRKWEAVHVLGDGVKMTCVVFLSTETGDNGSKNLKVSFFTAAYPKRQTVHRLCNAEVQYLTPQAVPKTCSNKFSIIICWLCGPTPPHR